MSGLEIVAVVIGLITIPIIFKKLKKSASCSHCPPKVPPINEPKVQEPVEQQVELKPADKSINSEAQTDEAVAISPADIGLSDTALSDAEPSELQTDEAAIASSPELEPAAQPIGNIEPSVKPQTHEATASPPENNSSLPEDSILKRHYLTHVCTLVEALVPPRPTDAVLCRHYDAMILAKIDQCLNDKQAMERLIYDYENLNV